MHDQRAIRLVWVSHTGIILRNDSDALDDGRHGMFTGLFAAVSCLALPPVRWLLFKTGLLPNTHVFINEWVGECVHARVWRFTSVMLA